MAQKPVPNALILELEPVVQQELRRHIDTEDLWYAHDYVPFDQGENFAFLGGNDWDPSQVTLPKTVTDALEILLITKDNLAGYHREFVFSFILDDKWGIAGAATGGLRLCPHVYNTMAHVNRAVEGIRSVRQLFA